MDLVIDDTLDTVILSSFDPVRREVARVALERLILDGRIHPGRIEKMVEKAQEEIDQTIREKGEEAALSMGVHGPPPEIIRLWAGCTIVPAMVRMYSSTRQRQR